MTEVILNAIIAILTSSAGKELTEELLQLVIGLIQHVVAAEVAKKTQAAKAPASL